MLVNGATGRQACRMSSCPAHMLTHTGPYETPENVNGLTESVRITFMKKNRLQVYLAKITI